MARPLALAVACGFANGLPATADEAAAKRFLDELSFMARTTRDPNGDRSTASISDCHDLCCGATASNSDESAPPFGARVGAIDEGLGQINLAAIAQILGERFHDFPEHARLDP